MKKYGTLLIKTLRYKLLEIRVICHSRTSDIKRTIYDNNNLSYTYKKYLSQNSINALIPFLKHDKKNNDNKINFILLKKIGKTTLPNKNKISLQNLKKLSKFIARY